MRQKELNDKMISLIEKDGQLIEYLIGAVAGLKADVLELKGETPDPELRRLWLRSTLNWVRARDESVVE